ncbi:MAG: FKBP-type peptidyl-prolyl cis-trans isomerase [Clostridiales bacterium]|nr:FKBP-type peptidyl-prolyl cis-trans isomerase [Clostridiales bacterium]
MKRIAITLLASACLLTAWCRPATEPSDSLAADSVSVALATVWGAHMTPVIEKNYPADNRATAEFTRGIKEAFNISPVDEPYYQGILQGLTLVERLEQMRDLGFPINRDRFIEALSMALLGESMPFTPTGADQYLNNYMSRQYEQQMAADTLSRESQQLFLDRQAAREGVIKTPTGLLFEVITEGEGDGPSMNDAVNVTYVGKLYNGEVFDESENEVTFPVAGLVPGFTQGLLMMKPGGTYRIIIPAELGYGPKGTSGVIPGNAALDFTITLHNVVKR